MAIYQFINFEQTYIQIISRWKEIKEMKETNNKDIIRIKPCKGIKEYRYEVYLLKDMDIKSFHGISKIERKYL